MSGIKVEYELTDGGSTGKLTSATGLLKKNMDEVVTSATRASVAVKAAMAPTGGSKTKAALQGATMSPQEGIEYGQARAAVGTGAASRDFAKQAQGLGGLVHVYATFAANLFAVSAAFTVLKNAADTTNMIKGLDQLGAQGGRNLGALSKRVAELSDGAVSLREAMTATAQATAAGMSSKNLERLTLVAKNASQALGLSMPDALSRLSRGVTKLEPELLDELGIFVKVDDAVTNYARSVGKTATGLTDFERRHAFAIAAIEQGEKKFGSIQMDANPYSKLLASISNLGQKTLEFINTGLTPLISFLSQSPTALGVSLAGVATILLKQAIPALGMYRENARKMAEEAHNRVLASVEDQKAAASELDSIAAIKAEKAFQTEKATQDRIAKLQKGRFSQEILGKELRTSLKKSPFEITPEETQALKSRAEALLASDDDTYKKQGSKLALHLSKMDALRSESIAKGDAAAAANEARDAKWYSHQEQMQRNLERLNRAATKRQLLAGVADTAAVLGPVEAFKQLKKETNSLDVSKASKSLTMLQGSLSIVSSAAVTAINAFGPWIAIFGLVSAAISGLIGYLSETAKESAATAEAFDSVSSSIDNVTRTMEALEQKSPLEKLNVESIQARATAFSELATSIALANQRAFVELDKMGNTDKFVDWVKKLWGGDVQSKLNEMVAKGIEKSFVAMERGPAADKVREIIKNTLKIDAVDSKSITQALDSLPEVVRKVKLDTITSELKAAGIAAQVTAAKGVELKESYAQATKQLQDLRNSFIPSDAVSKLGNTIIENATKLDLALKDPVQTLNAMNAAVKDNNSLSLFPPETAQALIALKSKVDGLNNSYSDIGKSIEDINSKISKLDTEKLSLSNSAKDNLADANRLRLVNQELEKLRDQKEVKTKLLFELDADTKVLGTQFKEAVGKQFEYGAKLISDKLSVEWAKAGSIIGNTIAGLLGDTKAGIEMRAKYESAALSAQKQQILTQIQLIKSNEQLAIALEQASIDTIASSPNSDANDRKLLAPRQAVVDKRKAMLDGKVTQGSTAALAKEIEKGTVGARESLNYVMAAEGAFAAMENISAQIGALAIKKAVELINLRKKDEQQKLDRDSEELKTKQETYAVVESIVGADSQLLLQQKQKLSTEQLDLDNKKKLLEVTKQIEVFEELKKSADPKSKEGIEAEISKLEIIKKQTVANSEQARVNLLNKNTVEDTKNQYALQSKDTAKNFAILEETQTIEAEKLSIATSLLESYKERGAISEKEYINSKLVLENDRARLDTQSKIDKIRNASNIQITQAESQIDLAKQKLPGASPEATKVLNDEISRQQTLINDATASSDRQIQSLVAELAVRLNINSATAKQSELLLQIKDVTQTLTAVFGDLGTAIGGSVSALLEYGAGSENMNKRHTDTLRNLEKNSDAYNTQEKKNAEERTKFELTYGLAAVSATKKVFKEKTGAYKVLDSLEKAMHTYKMVMMVKEVAMDLWKTGQSVINSFTRSSASAAEATIDGSAAIVNQGKGDPYTAFARMAAMAVFVGSILGKVVGGGGNKAPFVPSSEQRQETQGTAQGYDANGKLVQTNRGVFGDLEAKSESIVNSLEIIKDTSVKGLDYDDKMLRALQNLNNALDDTAKGLYAITGLRSGSLSGVVEGSNTSGGFLGISGLFSTSTSKSIVDSGLQLKGTFLDLVKGIESTINTFEVVSTTVKKSGFLGIGGSTRTSISTNFKELSGIDPKAFQSLVSAFGYASDLLYSIADTADVASSVVTEAMSKVQVDQMASLRGLTGEEFTKELGAVIGNVLDQTALVIFSEYEQFAKFGEGMLETVVRVVDTNRKILQQLQNTFGTDLMETLSLQGVVPAYKEAVTYSLKSLTDISPEELSKAASVLGDNAKLSTDSFISRWFGTVTDSAITSLQNLSQTDLQKLSDAGITFVDKAVTVISNGITRSFASADIKFASTQITEDLARLAGGLQNFLDQSNYFLDNFFTAAERAVPVQKAVVKQLAALGYASVDTKAEFKALVQSLDLTDATARQTYQALMDIAPGFMEVFDVLDTQSQAIKDTVSNFESFIKQIKDFKASLLLSADSILTPAQKYAEAKAQFETVYAKAMTGDKDSLSKVTSSAQSFLDASRTYFASSEAYTTDFNTVLSKLDNSTISAQASIDVAQLQLDNLSIQTDLLTSINTNIALIAGVPAAASGGRVSGLTLVGEMGPELVDFTTPGRVYTADETAGMFAPINGTSSNVQQVLVQELQNLRQEVAKLREQQSTETGHLINATYDAQNRNAEQVTEGVMDAAARQAWVANFRENALINK